MAAVSERRRYEYQPLGPGEIRILRLRPGSDGSALSGDLLVVPIHADYLVYDALSYMWGDSTPTDVIYLSDEVLPIAANLTAALHHLRYIHRPLVLWVDAISINQDDIAERELQIRIMRQIFSLADTVRIWINEPDVDDTNEAVSALKDFSNASDREFEELGPNPSFWDPVVPIFSNPYWNRAWVQQELAPEWGRHMMPFALYYTPAANDIAIYADGIKLWQLLRLLTNCSNLAMTDTRDRVYALMHLAEDYEEGGIEVDYAKNEVDVMIEAVAYHVARAQDIDFLDDCALGVDKCSVHDGGTCLDVPSWLPRVWLGCDTGHSLSSEKGPMQTRCLPNSILTTERRLRVRGLRFNTVRRCLNRGIDSPETTIEEFWISSFGIYLRVFGGYKVQSLPRELYSILVQNFVRIVPSFNDMVLSLSTFLRLAQDPQLARREVGIDGSLLVDLVKALDGASIIVLGGILELLQDRMLILNETGNLGLISKCDLDEKTDEIWVALGCSYPIILRPTDNGRYQFVCAAYIPKLEEFQVLKDLSSYVQPEDKVGEWTVVDIEIE
ncbi:uncharacterized protein K460DRAFT_271573 [Cucurbitaria berberidis CBS 394.84]|uniref:Heterokaryon incompatibility domain-containing protein n=1 Tax=Cucurbitaria berberidis CBS 394.84 TaxID=1168544 RepID=A0A9P4GS20_9PLEO|nr:uncharacterized protein K460DRAFT_271573 [Cucurbitaria berberidis CBS 394.84]KAF1850710.1 hypothetical protein K460DRAFT_271573 [Cucurbitaria berberidis CBS 394.84]